jgi:hypothetical protein
VYLTGNIAQGQLKDLPADFTDFPDFLLTTYLLVFSGNRSNFVFEAKSTAIPGVYLLLPV